MKSYIYFFKESENSLVKIGKSDNPHSRLISLKNTHKFLPHESFVVEVESADAAFAYENSLHKMFGNERNIQSGNGGTEFFNDCILEDAKTMAHIIAKNNNTTVDTNYFKRFFVGVDNPIYEPNGGDRIETLLIQIGDRCKCLRLNKNITQEELAEACSLALGTIKAAERGKVKLENMLKIMLVLGETTFLDMLDDVEATSRCRASKI